MILCLQRRFAFIAIPKTGTTSIELALRRLAHEGGRSFLGRMIGGPALAPLIARLAPRLIERGGDAGLPKHATLAELDARVGLSRHGIRTFAFVRNPWSRLYSQYCQLRKPINLTRPRRRRLHEAARVSFEAFVTAYAEAPRPMWGFLVDAAGRLAVDYVGRFEFLQPDFDEVCRLLGIPAAVLPTANQSESRADYRSAYPPAVRRVAAPVLARDCELFGYDFEGLSQPHAGVLRPAASASESRGARQAARDVTGVDGGGG